jgi:DNA polymerase-3 subunit delta'
MHPWNEGILQNVRQRLEALPHALLIHGPRGVGKLALAGRVAQLLLCEGRDPKPCNACDACRWYGAGNHPDFRRVEPEALAPETAPDEDAPEAPARRAKPSFNILTEQIRDLSDFLYLRSHRGARRVALIHPAEVLYPNAANALLKGLEEPPAGAMFLLVSHQPARLLPTIRSRCVSIAVPLPPRDLALGWLKEQGARESQRWLDYAGGAPLRAVEHAADSESLDRLLRGAVGRTNVLADDRNTLEALIDALQKIALDRALVASGLPAKYGTPGKGSGARAKAWLDYARAMGQDRELVGHPLNSRLFAAAMQAAMPNDEKS